MLRIDNLNPRPIVSILYDWPGAGPVGRRREIPLLAGVVSGLPPGLDGIVLTSDLIGPEAAGAGAGSRVRLGAVLATWLDAMGSSGAIPELKRSGVVIAGDLCLDPAGAAGGGDATGTWESFASNAKWVVGVAGDRDCLEANASGVTEWRCPGGWCCLLDGAVKDLGALRVAGLGGVIGGDAGPSRRPEPDYLETLRRISTAGPDLVVLHQPPDGRTAGCDGSTAARDCLERLAPKLVVAGHTTWPEALVTLRNGSQVLNVAGRVVVLRRGE